MAEKTSTADNNKIFKNKIWITIGIVLLVLLSAYFFATLLNLFLLVLAGVLMSVYFHAGANFLKLTLKMGSPYAFILSVTLNIIILGLFIWFVEPV